jgi:two-component system, chemotaxis family, chemotaxis protein CheY
VFDLTTIRVLIVDDSRFMRRLVRSILRSLGVKDIIDTDRAEMAIGFVKAQDFDVVILDWVMPGIGGAGFCDAARHIARVKPMPPIVVITAHATRKVVLEAIRAGVDQILVKPFSATSLRDRLITAIESQEQAETPTSPDGVFFL